MYIIKHLTSDFVVQEKITLAIDSQGQYTYYKLEKTDQNTFSMVDTIADMLHVPRKCINLSGIKDKKAITTQYISVLHGPKKDIETVSFKLTYVDNGNERINRGTLEGNSFSITIRNIDTQPEKVDWIINYFDAQRFGRTGNNADIGRYILQEKFEEAAELILAQNQHMEGRTAVEKLLSLTKDRLQFYIFAYQSHLWNKAVMEYLNAVEHTTNEGFIFPTKRPNGMEVPILGFLTELETLPYGPIYQKLLKSDNLTQHSFLIRRLRGMSFDGTTRPLIAPIQEMILSPLEDDECHPGKKKIVVDFFLGKGSYATMVIKRMFG